MLATATTIGSNMMQFSQAITPTGGGVGATGSETALATGKGFNQDQIAKLKDASCGVHNAQQIPAIWSVIQSTKGKSLNTYHAHIAKSINLWYRSHHIDHDKSISSKQSSLKTLWPCISTQGGAVAQFHAMAWGMSMLACHLLTAVEAEFCREFEEAAADTKHTCSLEDLLKRNHGKTVGGTRGELYGPQIEHWYVLWPTVDNLWQSLLLKIYCILDCKECFTIHNAYTREVCARITWAIVNEGRLFFGWNPMASDFEPGMTFVFSTCFLEGITDSARNAIPIQWAMFPCEWMVPLKEADTQFGRLPPGPPPTQWDTPALAPPLTEPPTTRPGQEDIRNPKTKLLMDPYLKRYNNFVSIADILTAPRKRMMDLPTLPKYCHLTGQSFLCWNSILGKCFCSPWCKFSQGHVKKGDSTDAFAKGVTNVISKRVIYYTNLPAGEGGGGSPRNKCKGRG